MLSESEKIEFCKLRDFIIYDYFKKLNEQQIEAVLNKDKNLMLLACPGSGKTTVLINKAAALIKFGNVYNTNIIPNGIKAEDIALLKACVEYRYTYDKLPGRAKALLEHFGVDSANMIVITFTKAAATNMKNRYEKLNIGKRTPFFGTFHGLFYKILIRHFGRINIIGTGEIYKVINETLVAYLDEVGEDKIKEVINYISLFKTSGMNLEEFEPKVDKKIFEKCYDNYETYKKEKNLNDFDDLQIKCKELFLSNPMVLDYYRRSFSYILVDEFQDCDGLQIDILKLLNEKSSIFAVGDEDQCIYGFRGSRPDCMVDFTKHFGEGKKLYLSINYRSPSNVVEISKNLIDNNNLRNSKEIHSNKKEKKEIKVIHSVNENRQAENIGVAIEKLKNIGNYKYEENAVLYRTNLESRSLIDAFIRRKIPFKLLDKEYNFFEHFICKDLLAYLRLSIDSTDRESFTRIINKPFRYVSKINIDKLRKSQIKEDCFEFLKSIDGLPIFQIKSIDRLRQDVRNLNKMSLGGAIEFIISDLLYHDYIKEYSSKFKIDISELEEILEEFKEAASQFKTIITFLAHVDTVTEEIHKNKNNKNEDSVVLSTIHGVKGMEFKNVFIVNCNEDNIPHENSVKDNLEEERRLFYVAITRTEENLYICAPSTLRGKKKDYSRFIDECSLSSTESIEEEYKIGEAVFHSTFGNGKITFIDKDEIGIMFDNGIERRFDIVVVHNHGILQKVG